VKSWRKTRVYFIAQSRSQSLFTSYLAHFATGELEKISEGMYGMYPMSVNASDEQFILAEQFGLGDTPSFIAPAALTKGRSTFMVSRCRTAGRPGGQTNGH
jgi:hypothetical protein